MQVRLTGPIARVTLALGVLLSVTSAQAQSRAYVANSTSSLVTVIDTATETVVQTIPVSPSPSQVAVSSSGARAYVTHPSAGLVSVIDTATNAVTATVPVPGAAYAAVTPNGQRVYVTGTGGVTVIDTATNTAITTIATGVGSGGIAITPDGARAYQASGVVKVIDTATNTVSASLDTVYPAGPIVITPDGTRAYLPTNGADIFGFLGGVIVLDLTTNAALPTLGMGVIPGQIAMTPDGSRVYVAVAWYWVDTGYGAAFFPGSSAAVIETASNTFIGSISFGSDGNAWGLQNSASGMTVAPDRSDLYVSIPRINVVAVVGVSANVVRQHIPVSTSPVGVAAKPDGSAIIPYTIDAVNDVAPAAVPSTGGTAVANVLANDKLGGLRAATSNVTLSQLSSTSASVTLNTASGAVNVAAGTTTGPHSLAYQICEIGMPTNCDSATVSLSVRDPYVIDAVNDTATSVHGKVAIANVLVNDTLGGVPASVSTVTLTTLSSTNAGITLNASNGAVSVALGTPAGIHTLTYQICEKASPQNCDSATATVTVVPIVIDAVNDSGTAPRTGGTAVANVLANDKFDGVTATLSKVSLSLVSSTNAGVTLVTSSGAVNVAAGTPHGAHSLVYKICELAAPTNCDTATVAVTVNPYVIDAVNDYGKGASKYANTVIANVLANDRLGNAVATPANVQLSMVSLTPANPKIRLDTADGSVDVLGKTNSGIYYLVYKICEIGNLSNCDQATATVELSGGL